MLRGDGEITNESELGTPADEKGSEALYTKASLSCGVNLLFSIVCLREVDANKILYTFDSKVEAEPRFLRHNLYTLARVIILCHIHGCVGKSSARFQSCLI
jgi:hypothetical protein